MERSINVILTETRCHERRLVEKRHLRSYEVDLRPRKFPTQKLNAEDAYPPTIMRRSCAWWAGGTSKRKKGETLEGFIPLPRAIVGAPGRASSVWRRGWDSNPRSSCPDSSFRDCPIRPLSHLSVLQMLVWLAYRENEAREVKACRAYLGQ
jgi:hypothetical protein